jgi:hypothetical protein
LEIQKVTSEIDALKDKIREHDGIIESLANVKQRKEEEIVHLQKLIASLKSRRLENIMISKDRIIRQETSLRSTDDKQTRLASQKDNLLRAERIFKTHSSIAEPQTAVFGLNSRPADLQLQERKAVLPNANQQVPYYGDPIAAGTARFPTIESYLSPKGSRLSQPRLSQEESVPTSQRQVPFQRFEHSASLKLRANMMLDSIDKDLKRIYK